MNLPTTKPTANTPRPCRTQALAVRDAVRAKELRTGAEGGGRNQQGLQQLPRRLSQLEIAAACARWVTLPRSKLNGRSAYVATSLAAACGSRAVGLEELDLAQIDQFGQAGVGQLAARDVSAGL